MTNPDAMRITIQGLELPLPPPFTNRELHLIKQISGVRAGDFVEALEHGDNDVLVALAHIALRRAGRVRPTLEELWDMGATEILAAAPETDDDQEPGDPTTAGDADTAGSNGSPVTHPNGPGVPSTVSSST